MGIKLPNSHIILYFVTNRRTPRSTLFPYTTLFRSERKQHRRRPNRIESWSGIERIERQLPGEKVLRERVVVQTPAGTQDRKSTRLNSSHVEISYAVFCLKKKTNKYDFKKHKRLQYI